MDNENIVPITYNGKIIGYTDSSKTLSSIEPIDSESREILEELMSSPIYISSRQQNEENE
jgi:putative methionine-R-sulfoxide reductase with GAF domain